MKNLSYLLVVLSLLFVGCNDDDNDDDANLPEVGTKHLLQLLNIGIWIWMALRGLSKQLMMR